MARKCSSYSPSCSEGVWAKKRMAGTRRPELTRPLLSAQLPSIQHTFLACVCLHVEPSERSAGSGHQ